MLVQVVLTTLLALGVAPCVLQRACPVRTPRPPTAVCMHRMHPDDKRARVRAAGAAGVVGCCAASRAAAAATRHADRARAAAVAAGRFGEQEHIGKAERAMFLAHSEACLGASGARREQAERLAAGGAEDSPALRRLVLCVLRRCKLLRKDGRLDKHALRDRARWPAAARHAKILEGCAEQSGDSPEDLAWQLFRCGLNKKVLFEHMAAAPNAP